MKNTERLFTRVSCLLSLLVVMACSVDKAYDLSKDIDMTVSVGEGLTIPLGSTEKILLTEMIDTLDSDVIRADENGYYSIYKKGEIDASEFIVNDVSIEVEPYSEEHTYDLAMSIVEYDDLNDLPESIRDKILNMEFPYVVEDVVNQEVEYDINQEVPEEMKSLKRMTFKKPVEMTLDIDVYSHNESKEYLDLIRQLHLHTSGEKNAEHFYVEMPPYIVFDETDENVDLGEGNKLYLDHIIEHNEEKGHKHFTNTYRVVGLDFSYLGEEGITVVGGRINDARELKVNGVLKSDTITMKAGDMTHITDIVVAPKILFGKMEIATVDGYFEPEIDEVNESVEIDLGDDLDFIYEGTFDFTNPQLFVTIHNDAPLCVSSDITLVSYDKNGTLVEDSKIETKLAVQAECENKYYISRYDTSLEGYTTVQIPNLNKLMMPVPDKVEINLNSCVDNSKGSTLVTLGKSMSVSGSYELVVPMEFDALELEYTETVENVLGDTPEDITDYIDNIESITLSLVVDNTVPASFMPAVTAYAKDSKKQLNGVVAEVSNPIAAGEGYKDGVLTAPVETQLDIVLSATNNQLKDLGNLDIVFKGIGCGVLNTNEYIQLKKISVKIDKPIEVDLN